jgi:hypothetical protein
MSTANEPKQAAPVPTVEASVLAREMAADYRAHVEHYQKHYKLSPAEAMAKSATPVSPEYEASILQGPHEEVSWLALRCLTERDPDLAAQCWANVKRAAWAELQSGQRAAKAVEGASPSPWTLAQYLVLRTELAREWQPRSGIEWQLIDALAMSQTQFFFWMERQSVRSTMDAVREQRDIQDRGSWYPPRVTDAEAVEQAAAMAERFHRMGLRTIRALQELRRRPPPVVVGNVSQLNVGEQQVNVAG